MSLSLGLINDRAKTRGGRGAHILEHSVLAARRRNQAPGPVVGVQIGPGLGRCWDDFFFSVMLNREIAFLLWILARQLKLC